MAETQAPYQNMEQPSKAKQCCRCFGKYAGIGCGIFIVIIVVIQAVLYKWATLNCSAGHLQNYEYPGGGSANLVPPDSLLVQQSPRWWGQSFVNIPSDKVGLAGGASTGVYFRTWGPIFNTFVYQDVLSTKTFVVRDRPIALGGSHNIMRCDGEGDVWVISEGGHYFMNMIRSLFGMYTSRVYNIWKGNELVAVSEKLGGVGQSYKQIIFRQPDKAMPFASVYLKDRHFHGEFDEWFVQNDKNSSLPNFVPNSAAMLMAFTTADIKNAKLKKEAAAAGSHSTPKPSELVELPTVAMTEVPAAAEGTNPLAYAQATAKALAAAKKEVMMASQASHAAAKAKSAAATQPIESVRVQEQLI